MGIILIIYLVLIFLWLLGVGIAAYHVFKYRIPGDATVRAFWMFLIISMVTLLFVVYIVSGAEWGGI